jgi:hypothetical protein
MVGILSAWAGDHEARLWESATLDEMEVPGERGREPYQCPMTSMSLNAVGTNNCQKTGFCDWRLLLDVCVNCDDHL